MHASSHSPHLADKITEDAFSALCDRFAWAACSQIGQDLFIAWASGGQTDGYFVEIGSSDGVSINNTYLLEKAGWTGILVEPNPERQALLRKNRSARCVEAAVWPGDAETLTLDVVIEDPDLSGLRVREALDRHDEVGVRTRSRPVEVDAISPRDLLENHSAPRIIDYLSIDTEGAELEILSGFPFDDYQVRFITVEHNHTKRREAIDTFLNSKGFVRVLAERTDFESWYVHTSLQTDPSEPGFKRFLSKALQSAGDLPPAHHQTVLFNARTIINAAQNGRGEASGDNLAEFARWRSDDLEVLLYSLRRSNFRAAGKPIASLLEKIVEQDPQNLCAKAHLTSVMRDADRREARPALIRSIVAAPENSDTELLTKLRAFIILGRPNKALPLALALIERRLIPTVEILKLARQLWSRRIRYPAIGLLRRSLAAMPGKFVLNRHLFDFLIAWKPGPHGGLTMPDPVDFDLRIDIAETGLHCLEKVTAVDGAGGIVEKDGERYQRMFDGTLVPADKFYGEWMTRLITRLGGHHEPQEEAIFLEILKRLKPGSLMVEVGAYWACYSAMFLRHFKGDAKSILIEPSEINLEVGRQTMAVNGFDPIMIRGAIPPLDDLFVLAQIEHGEATPSPEFSLSGYIKTSDIESIDLLLADIQGAETNLLEDVKELMADGRIRYLVISTHGPGKHRDCLTAIRDAGYWLIAEHDGFESFSVDGLIAAKAPHVAEPGYIDVPRRSFEVKPLRQNLKRRQRKQKKPSSIFKRLARLFQGW